METDAKRFIKRAIIFSCIAAVVIVTACCAVWVNLPEIYHGRIASLAEKGDVEEAEAKLEELKLIVGDDIDEELLRSCKYDIAEGMYNNGQFIEAQQAFAELEGYSDSGEMIKKCAYRDAEKSLDSGEYAIAAEKFLKLGAYSDSPYRYKECLFAIAEETCKSGDYSGAISQLLELGDFPGAKDRALEIAVELTGDRSVAEGMISGGMSAEEMDKIIEISSAKDGLRTETAAAGREHSVALRADGTVVAAGSNKYGQCDVSDWKDITAVSAGAYFTLGLKSDGTVVAAGSNSFGQCNVSDWKNVTKITAGDFDAFALCADGTILTAGYHDYSDMLSLSNVKDIYAGGYQLVCTVEDGSAVASHISAAAPHKPIGVALSTGTAVYLMPNGTVRSDFERVPKWEDMIYVTANSRAIIGITAEGEVRSFFFRNSDKIDFDFGGEKVVAASAGGGHYLFVTESGNVLAFGKNGSGQCKVDQWKLW